MNLFFLSALIPFLVVFLMLVVWKKPAVKTMPVAFFVTAFIAFGCWNLGFKWIAGSFIKGVFLSAEILLIVFGAVWLLEILNVSGKMNILKGFFSSISEDARIQGIIVAWLFGSLIEGVAGFGTPAAITSPLLVSLGFSAFGAVVLSLIANSSAVSFGAAGTPILLGFGSLGIEANFLRSVAEKTALIHLFGGLLVTVSIVYFIVFVFSGKERKKERFFEAVPFAIFSSLAFTIPYYLIARFVGTELPSIGGALIGLFIVGVAAKKGFLIPKNKIVFLGKRKIKKYKIREVILAFTPYIAIVLLLSISRVVAPLKTFLLSFGLGWDKIIGLDLSYKFNFLYTPSVYFILAGIIGIFVFRVSGREAKESLKNSLSKIWIPAVALTFTLALVQLLLVSSNNSLGLPSMPVFLAEEISEFSGKAFVFISPLIGAFGAFIAGSNTVSNLLFGTFQAGIASELGISIVLILALQCVGGAIGNMFAIHNILAAGATVGYHGNEGSIIRKTIVVALIYALIAGTIGFLLMTFV